MQELVQVRTLWRSHFFLALPWQSGPKSSPPLTSLSLSQSWSESSASFWGHEQASPPLPVQIGNNSWFCGWKGRRTNEEPSSGFIFQVALTTSVHIHTQSLSERGEQNQTDFSQTFPAYLIQCLTGCECKGSELLNSKIWTFQPTSIQAKKQPCLATRAFIRKLQISSGEAMFSSPRQLWMEQIFQPNLAQILIFWPLAKQKNIC